jgi:hypothetical protein
MRVGRFGSTVAASLALWAGGAVLAHAQDAQAPGGSPPLDVLVRCADMANKDSRLACYDAAMRAAGYAPKPEAVEAEHRRGFGLTMPRFGGSKQASKKTKGEAVAAAPAPEGNPDEVTVEVSQVAVVQPVGRLVIFTADGQIWEQTDQDQIADKPKPGSSIRIHREILGGYFCDVNKYKSVRCKRDR